MSETNEGRRCERCDRPVASEADFDAYRGGEGGHLCWGGACPAVDWRSRAMAAEALVTNLKEYLSGVNRERDRLLAREAHFAKVLGVADGGRYRTDWDAPLRRVLAERDSLRAIVRGRPTPPTDAEIDAHEKTGGRWRCLVPKARVFCADSLRGHAARCHRDTVVAAGFDSVWWPLDCDEFPTVWPVVEEEVTHG